MLAHAAEPTLLHVNTFPTARSLPFYVAVDRGFFARHGLKVELEFTESSERQREGLADGTVDIVHSAVDNAVAMIDVAKVDVVIVCGGDSGTNEFYVQDTSRIFPTSAATPSWSMPPTPPMRCRPGKSCCSTASRTAPTTRSIRSATARGAEGAVRGQE